MRQFALGLFVISLLTSCGISRAVITNQNQNITQVVLSGNNFRVVQQVRGSASVQYFLFMGGTWKGSLYAKAYSDMMSQANMIAGPRAVVNVVTSENVDGMYPLYFLKTVTVTAEVIEFISPPKPAEIISKTN